MSLTNMNAPLPAGGLNAGSIPLPEKGARDYPTRLVEVKPGSRVLVGGPKVGGPAFEATVLQMIAEFGVTGGPALIVAPDFAKAETLAISEASGYEVTVLANAADFLSDEAPVGSIRVHTIPKHGIAMRFTGGVENASQIIRWSLGRGAPRYIPGTDTDPEILQFGGIGANVIVARLGDWIVMHDDETFHVVKDLADAYEEEV